MNDERTGLEAWLRRRGSACRTERALEDGAAFGPFRVLGLLGRGGSAEVYRAERAADGAVVALKIPRRDDPASLERFRREARLLADRPHPALPRLVASGEEAGLPWIALEELFPLDLPRAPRAVERFLLALCRALAHLHALGFVHRDVKPSNILARADGSPVLIDLGLAKHCTGPGPTAAAVGPGPTILSVVDGRAIGFGTPGFAAPEQFTGEALSPAADVYALGMLALRCFGGRPPLLWRGVLRRATAPLPAGRFPDAAAFARALRRRRAPVLAAAAAALAAAGCAALSQIPMMATPGEAQARLLRESAPPALRGIASFGTLGGRPHVTIALGGRTVALDRPLRLDGPLPVVVEIEGPGRLEGVLEGATNDLVVLRGATLVDRTEDPDPAHSPRFRLEAGGYLALPEILSLHARDWAEPYDEPDPAAPKPDDRAVRFGHGLEPDLRAQLLRERGMLSDERVRAESDFEVPAPELGAILLPDGPTNVLWSASALHPWRVHPTEPGVLVCDLGGGFGESWIRMRADCDVKLRLRYKKSFAGADDHGGRGGVFEEIYHGMTYARDASDGKLSDGWRWNGRENLEFHSGAHDFVIRFRSDAYTIPGHFNGVLLRAAPR